MLKRLVLSALFFTTPTLALDATPQAYQNLLTPLLQSGTDVLGDPLVYPEGTPNVTAAIVTIRTRSGTVNASRNGDSPNAAGRNSIVSRRR